MLAINSTGDCTNDGFEPNDSQIQAVGLAEGSYPAKICPGDEDWFAITVNNGDSLAIAGDGAIIADMKNDRGVAQLVLKGRELSAYREQFPCHLDADTFQVDMNSD